MKLTSFSIKNYRSIKNAKKISLDNYTVMIGPNNEGKSNILKGLATALSLAVAGDYRSIRFGRGATRTYRYSGDRYVWERDIPFDLKDNEDSKTVFNLEFELLPTEKAKFKREIGTTINTTLTLKLELGLSSSKSSYDILLQGKGKQNVSQKKDKVAIFLKELIDFQYIPCIRTEELALNVIEELVARLFSTNKAYQTLLAKIEEIQNPLLETLQREVSQTVKEFVPDVKSVIIQGRNQIRSSLMRPLIQIDDGTITQLEEKGDGVKSLTAIAVMRYAIKDKGNKNLLILIEEPESHLHPKAIHGLRKVLIDISENYQVIISTHSPLLIDRVNISNNVIVKGNKANHSRDIKEIRDCIGVEVSDNLSSSQFIILVEGESDKKIIDKLLTEKSSFYQNLNSSHVVVIDDLGGGSKASYKAGIYKSMLCEVHLLADSDTAGENCIKDALGKKVLEIGECTKVAVPGMQKSEIEDLFDLNEYKAIILSRYNVNLDNTRFKSLNKPWSERIKKEFEVTGTYWDEQVEKELKILMADLVLDKGYNFIHQARRQFIDSFIATIDRKLEKIKNGEA